MARIGIVVFSGMLLFGISGCGNNVQSPVKKSPESPGLSSNIFVTGVRCVSKREGSNGQRFLNTYIEIYSDGTERVQSTVASKEKCA